MQSREERFKSIYERIKKNISVFFNSWSELAEIEEQVRSGDFNISKLVLKLSRILYSKKPIRISSEMYKKAQGLGIGDLDLLFWDDGVPIQRMPKDIDKVLSKSEHFLNNIEEYKKKFETIREYNLNEDIDKILKVISILKYKIGWDYIARLVEGKAEYMKDELGDYRYLFVLFSDYMKGLEFAGEFKHELKISIDEISSFLLDLDEMIEELKKEPEKNFDAVCLMMSMLDMLELNFEEIKRIALLPVLTIFGTWITGDKFFELGDYKYSHEYLYAKKGRFAIYTGVIRKYYLKDLGKGLDREFWEEKESQFDYLAEFFMSILDDFDNFVNFAVKAGTNELNAYSMLRFVKKRRDEIDKKLKR